MRDLDDITETIIDAAIQIHRDLGPGLLESVYEAVLARALTKRGLLLTYLRLMNKRVGLLINFGGNTLKDGLRRVVNDLHPSESPRLRVNQSA